MRLHISLLEHVQGMSQRDITVELFLEPVIRTDP